MDPSRRRPPRLDLGRAEVHRPGTAPIRVGISSCLLGQPVRYDGGHKRDRFASDQLANFVEWVPVCPELESGLGVPRPPMRLVRDGDAVRLLEIASRRDHTRRMQRFAAKRVRALRSLDLCGFLLKRDSPSCGMSRVEIDEGGGKRKREGRGLFASALIEAFPSLPVEDEGRLGDARLRENFIERLFAYRRLRDLFSGRFDSNRVIAFHNAHALQLMAHSSVAHRELGKLVASIKGMPRAELRERYEAGFMAALARPATPGRNANVLRHAARHLSEHLDDESRAELSQLIRDYRKGLVPLQVGVTLFARHARRHEIGHLNGQTYLDPDPKELMLRNPV